MTTDNDALAAIARGADIPVGVTLPVGFHPDDLFYVILDALGLQEGLIAGDAAAPWADYTTEPENDPKCHADGYKAVLELAKTAATSALDNSDPHFWLDLHTGPPLLTHDPFGPWRYNNRFDVEFAAPDERWPQVKFTGWRTAETVGGEDRLMLEFTLSKDHCDARSYAVGAFEGATCIDEHGDWVILADDVVTRFGLDEHAAAEFDEWIDEVARLFREGADEASHEAVKAGNTIAVEKLAEVIASL